MSNIIEFVENFDSLDDLSAYLRHKQVIAFDPKSICISLCRINRYNKIYYQDFPNSEYIIGTKFHISSNEVINMLRDMLKNPEMIKYVDNVFCIYPSEDLLKKNETFYNFLYKVADMFNFICHGNINNPSYYNYNISMDFAYSWLEKNYFKNFEYKFKMLAFMKAHTMKNKYSVPIGSKSYDDSKTTVTNDNSNLSDDDYLMSESISDSSDFVPIDYRDYDDLRPDDPRKYYEDGLEPDDFFKYNPGASQSASDETGEELRDYINHRHI